MDIETSKKQCPICKQEIGESEGVEKSGKSFCSEEHAIEYSKKLSEGESKDENHGSCCG